MKSYLALIAGAIFTFTGLPANAEAREERRDLSRKHHDHDRDWRNRDHRDWHRDHRRSRRVYHEGHWERRGGRRIWIAPRSVVVYF